ncbi:hypothetical protein MRX96_023728 [Rhipicephalus microplus]
MRRRWMSSEGEKEKMATLVAFVAHALRLAALQEWRRDLGLVIGVTTVPHSVQPWCKLFFKRALDLSIPSSMAVNSSLKYSKVGAPSLISTQKVRLETM